MICALCRLDDLTLADWLVGLRVLVVEAGIVVVHEEPCARLAQAHGLLSHGGGA